MADKKEAQKVPSNMKLVLDSDKNPIRITAVERLSQSQGEEYTDDDAFVINDKYMFFNFFESDEERKITKDFMSLTPEELDKKYAILTDSAENAYWSLDEENGKSFPVLIFAPRSALEDGTYENERIADLLLVKCVDVMFGMHMDEYLIHFKKII